MARQRPTIQQQFGRRVRALRLAIDPPVSQEAFAHLVNLDRSYYGQIERGEANPSLATVAVLAAGLGVAPRDLFLFDRG